MVFLKEISQQNLLNNLTFILDLKVNSKFKAILKLRLIVGYVKDGVNMSLD